MEKNEFSPIELSRCTCPMMVMGTDAKGVYHNREALHTRDSYTAAEMVRKLEAGEMVRPEQPLNYSITDAFKQYIVLMRTQRGWAEGSVRLLQVIQRSLEKYAASKRLKLVREITTKHLDEWIAGWEVSKETRSTRGVYLRNFFEVVTKRAWIPTNPCALIMWPKAERQGKTEPFDLQTELPRIIAAIPHWQEGYQFQRRRIKNIWARHPKAAVGLLTVLRLTGMRISDAAKFNPNVLEKRVVEGREVYCYYAKKQKKTDYPVFIPFLPEEVEPILNAPWLSDDYAFWDGKTDSEEWARQVQVFIMRKLGKVAGVENVHAHRFRDTFAMDLFNRKVDIRTVSRLLGHKSVNTTLSHYEHYIREDQDRLVAEFLKGKAETGNVVQFPKQA